MKIEKAIEMLQQEQKSGTKSIVFAYWKAELFGKAAFDFTEESELLSTLKEIAVLAASKNDCRSDIIFIANEAIAKAEGAEL